MAAYYFALHASAWSRRLPFDRWRIHRVYVQPRVSWTLASISVVALCLSAAPIFSQQVGGSEVGFESRLSRETPVAAVAYLQSHPPQGQVFNTFEWGDYLLWAGPESVEVFVASHVHLVPVDVWQDYLDVVLSQVLLERSLGPPSRHDDSD